MTSAVSADADDGCRGNVDASAAMIHGRVDDRGVPIHPMGSHGYAGGVRHGDAHGCGSAPRAHAHVHGVR